VLDQYRTTGPLVREVSGPKSKANNAEDEITDIIASFQEDMVAIWGDPQVRNMLNRHNAGIEDCSGL
jgi:guanine nucleotide-binding protein subunit alpha